MPLVLVWFWLFAMVHSGFPGPNSGHAGQKLDSHYITDEIYGDLVSTTFTGMGGEGSGLAMQSWGGEREAPLGACPNTATKRSFRRALRRAQQFGWTTYRGQILSQKILPHVDSGVQTAKATSEIPSPRPGKRFTVMTWNAGGLTSPLYNELMHWGQSNSVDIMLIQSTRWREDKTWTSYGYSMIHTGEPADSKVTFAGLLVCISHRVCKFDAISYAPTIQGRLLHVKCRLHAKTLDILNVYQYTENVTCQVKTPSKARTNLWTQMDFILERVAFRNLLVIGGDFNCPLPGPDSTVHRAHPDQQQFAGVLKKHNLHTTRTHDGGPTFIGNQGSSTIDFLFFRKVQMDSLAHHGRCLKDFPLASWRESPDHLPILSSLHVGWNCWYAKPAQDPRLSRTTKENLFRAWQNRDQAWHFCHSGLTQQIRKLRPSLQAYDHFQNTAIMHPMPS